MFRSVPLFITLALPLTMYTWAEVRVYPNVHITGPIVDAAYRLHTRLGPGLLESVYETVFARMLQQAGLRVERQCPVPFEFEGVRFAEVCRVDLLVEKQVVVELKALEKLAPVHSRQLLTYLRLLNLPVGLLINFGAARLNDGLQRVLNSRASFYSGLQDFNHAEETEGPR